MNEDIIKSVKKYIEAIDNFESEMQKFYLDDGRKFKINIEKVVNESHIDL